ncbi:MarR family winged helix-turn-helix transcriptional regulator [Candidatus Izemoplasma sp. B36]|uniref:MarR family winged helix-turn-helix transcriptional regulator n=1 Tax=Candidatus Izemoplasma sp. B36 TaxID=3242468 RepID=UPI003556DA18
MNREFEEKELLRYIFMLSNKLQTFLDNQLNDDQLTTKQFMLLISLSTFSNPPTFSEVAKLMGTSRQNVKQLALKLEKNGWVTIEKDMNDLRNRNIIATMKSAKYFIDRTDVDKKNMNTLFDTFNDEKLKIIKEALLTIILKMQML